MKIKPPVFLKRFQDIYASKARAGGGLTTKKKADVSGIDFKESHKDYNQRELILCKEAGIKDFRSFLQAVSAMFGLAEGNDQLRHEKARDIIAKWGENTEIRNTIKEKAFSYSLAWTATGAHRYMPVALVIANFLSGKELGDLSSIPKLVDSGKEFKYLTETCPWFANPEGIPAEYLPPHNNGPRLSLLPQTPDSKYLWVDIGSAPKTGGAPTLNILRKVFSLLAPEANFKIYGTDRAFPYYKEAENDQAPQLSIYVDKATKNISSRAHDDKNDIYYLNAREKDYDITQGLNYFTEGSIHFLSVCKLLHHLAGETWERLPFSSLQIVNPTGTLRPEDLLVKTTRQQQTAVDTMLKKLAIGGLLLIEPDSYSNGDQHAWNYLHENNADLLFIIQRKSAEEYVLYDDYPVLYRPNSDIFSPQTESKFVYGNPGHRLCYYQHPGIASLYPGQPEEFYARIENLFARANKLAYAHQGWKKGVWGSVAAAVQCIQKENNLPAIFEAYLRHVPDDNSKDNSIKQKILAEAEAADKAATRIRMGDI